MKKRFLRLLCMSAGLQNILVETYRTDGCGGMYAIGVGYKINATDHKGMNVVHVETPEGFNDAVQEVMSQIYDTMDIDFRCVDTDDFKV